MKATCSDCSNTATASITVDAINMCSPGNAGGDSGGLEGNPLSPASSSKLQFETDYTDSAPHGLSFSRRYSSNADLANANLGGNWSHLYAANAKVGQDATQANVLLGDGSRVYFSRISDTAPWQAAVGNLGAERLDQTATQLIYTRASDDSKWAFELNGSGALIAAGKLQTITQRNGWTMVMAYNPAGQLLSVTNAFGRSLQLGYTANGLLATLTQPDGQVISYSYDSALRISGASYPGNQLKSYLYENSAFPTALTGIVDETGNRLATFSYDALGRAVGSTHAGGAGSTLIAYPTGDAASSIPAQGSLVADGSAVDPAIFRSTVQVTDALGNPRSVTYQGGDGFVRVLGNSTYAGGSSFASRSFDTAASLPLSETDYNGFVTLFSWDASRRIKTSETRAAGRPEAQTTNTVWHPTFRLPTQITEQGKKVDYTYDASGNKLSQTETDTTGTINSASPSNGQIRTWAWTYNTTGTLTGLVSTSTDPRGKVTSYAYDTAGNVASMTNPLGHVSSYLYDGAGRVTRTTEPNGLQTSMAYDARGRLTQTVRGASLAVPLQQKTVYTYTAPGQVASAVLPNGYQVTYSYDAAQRLIGAQDNRGNRISYTLDGMGNRVREEVKDASNQIALVTRRVINSLNRVSAIQGSGLTAPGGSTALGQTTLAYDANGEPVQSTDPLNQTTRQTLDALRRPTSTQLPDNAQASVAYNALNQITQAVDPKAVATVYVKNAWGEVLTETSPDSGATSTTRDAAGNVLTSTDARGNTTQYQYDNASRVSQITQADGKLQLFSYDGTATGNQLGYLREMQDTSGTTRYERDTFGRITKKTQVVLDNTAAPTTLVTSYAYTQAGDLAAIRYPSGLLVSYLRNATGQISGLQTKAGTAASLPTINFITNLQYTAWQQPQAWTWSGMGSTITAAISSASRSFDADGRMTANQVASYTFDAASRITSITQNLIAQRTVTTGTGTATTSVLQNYITPVKWTVGYDNRDRVVSFNRVDSANSSGQTSQYTYDPNSNRLTSIAQTTTDTNKDGLFGSNEVRKNTAQTLNLASNSNKLLGFSQVLTTITGTKTNAVVNSQVNYTLDPAGNLTSDGLRTFAYDTTNRLTTVTLGTTFVGTDTIAGNELASQSYLHNALGQRVFKSEPRTQVNPPNSSTLSPDFVTWLKNNFSWLWATAQTNATLGDSYNYGDSSTGIPSWALLGEYGNGGANSTGRTEYIWLPTEDGSGGGAIPVGMYRGGKFFAIHTDHLGTPRLITDNTNQPVWQWAYSAFGDNSPTGILKPTTNAATAYLSLPPTAGSGTTTATLLAVSAPAQVFNLRFPGQFNDSETGSFYNYFRTYQASQGRYTQNDPIGLAGGFNRYAYANGAPLMYTDPLGLWSVEIGIFGGLGGNVTVGKDPATGQKFGVFQFGYGIGGGVMYDPNGGLPKNLVTSSCEEETFVGGFGKAGVAGPGAALDVVSATGGINWNSGRPYGGVDWFTTSFGTKWGVKAEASGGVQFGKVSKPSNSSKCTCPGSRG